MEVTSLAEVWIEICACGHGWTDPDVTSLAEVWIEIRCCPCRWGCLCHFPCGSVDWNSVSRWGNEKYKRSLPLRKCGLKCIGRKRKWAREIVTSLAEVWIEIKSSTTGAWICPSHFPCGSVDWNRDGSAWGNFKNRHFPCGSVDWNRIRRCRVYVWCIVTSLAEVWIEIICSRCVMETASSLPLRKCGLKSKEYEFILSLHRSLPLRKCGLKSLNWSVQQSCRCHFPCGSVDWNLHPLTAS